MKVKELIENLQQFDQEMNVFLDDELCGPFPLLSEYQPNIQTITKENFIFYNLTIYNMKKLGINFGDKVLVI